MKTQINTLINGNHQEGVCGTNHNERNEIADKVVSENPEFLTIKIKDYVMKLKAQWSVSRKSCSYFGSIPIELYKEYFGDFGLPVDEPKAYIHIQPSMRIEFSTNSKKTMWQTLPNKEVTIL